MAGQLAVLRGRELAVAVERLGVPGDQMVVTPFDVRVVEVSLTMGDPGRAARAVNALADAYVARMDAASRDQAVAMRQQVDRELDEQKAVVDREQARLDDVQASIARLDTSAGLAGALATQVEAIQRERQKIEPLYHEMMTAADLSTVGAVVRDPIIRAKRLRIDDLEMLRASLSQRYGDRYPSVQQIDSTLAAARVDLDGLQQRFAALVRSEYENQNIQERLLAGELAKSRADADALARGRAEETSLQTTLDADRRLYDALAKKSRDLQVAALQQGSGARVIDHAAPPQSPEPIDQTWTWVLVAIACASALAASGGRRSVRRALRRRRDTVLPLDLPDVPGEQRHVA